MKNYSRTNSVVESVASAANSVRRQREEGLVAVQIKGTEVSAWIQEMIMVRNTYDSYDCIIRPVNITYSFRFP